MTISPLRFGATLRIDKFTQAGGPEKNDLKVDNLALELDLGELQDQLHQLGIKDDSNGLNWLKLLRDETGKSFILFDSTDNTPGLTEFENIESDFRLAEDEELDRIEALPKKERAAAWEAGDVSRQALVAGLTQQIQEKFLNTAKPVEVEYTTDAKGHVTYTNLKLIG